MEKTVAIICGNIVSTNLCRYENTFDIKLSNRQSLPVLNRTLWNCCVEGVLEYSRIVFDIFPDKYQV